MSDTADPERLSVFNIGKWKRHTRSMSKANETRQSGSKRFPCGSSYESVLGSRRYELFCKAVSLSQPSKKQREIGDEPLGNDTVIILSDDDKDDEYHPSSWARSTSAGKVCMTSFTNTDPAQHIMFSPPKRKSRKSSAIVKVTKKTRRKVNGRGRFVSLAAKKIHGNQISEHDDLEIIWSSNSNISYESKVVTVPGKNNEQLKHSQNNDDGKEIISSIDNFFIDTDRKLSNLSILDSIKDHESSDRQSENPKLPVVKRKRKTIPTSGGRMIENVNEKKSRMYGETGTVGVLREIVVDGCNVAMHHKNGNGFSEEGLKLVLNFFVGRGHTVKIFLPQHKRSPKNRPLIEQLHRDGIVVFTPSRVAGNKKITPYDDRYILDYATKCGGVIVTSDQYRDLYHEKPEWRETIENRLIAPTFVGDYVMFPEDPLGRKGPKLDQFLQQW